MDKALTFPELLETVPSDAFLTVPNEDEREALIVPVGRYCHSAAAELRRLSAVEAQRDALLEKIKAVIAAEQSEGAGRGGFVNTPPTREHQLRVAQAWQELHAAIKAVEEGK